MSHSVPKILSWMLSSQRRVFQTAMPEDDLRRLSGLRNEPLTFTLAYRADAGKAPNGRVPDTPIAVLVSSDTLPITVYKVLSVPFAASECEDAGEGAVGPCPDILQKRIACPELVHLEGEVHVPFYERDERVLLNASAVMTQSLSVTVNEAGEEMTAGLHEVLVRIVSLMSGEVLASHRLTVELIDALLPPCDLLYTNWVHYDCLADSSGLPLWSDAYFDLLGRYLKNATLHGMNTLLTPAFTPALDTPVGTERMNVQLVGVREEGDGYAFDFSLLRRFVTLARACGITCFEHCHLFSQWGAGCAINVYGERNRQQTRLFGWDTPANAPAYVNFLQSYLRAFLAFADEMGLSRENLLFHISDEPAEEHKENYAAAIATVSEVLDGQRIGDALSSYEFYRNGLVRLPIVDTAYADDFDGKCDHMMLYYTGGEKQPGLSNRLLTNAPSRTRVLGLHLYRYNAEGFLHWGYNYTYGRLSQGLFDPATDPCFYKNIPGVTYLVYGGRGAEPMPSLRERQMCEAINDYRALRLLESRIGRDATLRLCSEVMGGEINILTLPENATVLLTLRERINREIAEKG